MGHSHGSFYWGSNTGVILLGRTRKSNSWVILMGQARWSNSWVKLVDHCPRSNSIGKHVCHSHGSNLWIVISVSQSHGWVKLTGQVRWQLEAPQNQPEKFLSFMASKDILGVSVKYSYKAVEKFPTIKHTRFSSSWSSSFKLLPWD